MTIGDVVGLLAQVGRQVASLEIARNSYSRTPGERAAAPLPADAGAGSGGVIKSGAAIPADASADFIARLILRDAGSLAAYGENAPASLSLVALRPPHATDNDATAPRETSDGLDASAPARALMAAQLAPDASDAAIAETQRAVIATHDALQADPGETVVANVSRSGFAANDPRLATAVVEKRITDGAIADAAPVAGGPRTIEASAGRAAVDRDELPAGSATGDATGALGASKAERADGRDVVRAVAERASVDLPLAGAAGQQQIERAGVLASFILNAAMIPGWPPPKPFAVPEPEQLLRMLIRGPTAPATEMDILAYLTRFGLHSALLKRLFAFLERLTRAGRRKLLMRLTAMLAALKSAVTSLEEELALLRQELADIEALAGSRRRLRA